MHGIYNEGDLEKNIASLTEKEREQYKNLIQQALEFDKNQNVPRKQEEIYTEGALEESIALLSREERKQNSHLIKEAKRYEKQILKYKKKSYLDKIFSVIKNCPTLISQYFKSSNLEESDKETLKMRLLEESDPSEEIN